MRIVVRALIGLVIVVVVLIPLTGGWSLILLPIVIGLAVHFFGLFAVLTIIGKLIQKALGLRDGLSLMAITFSLFVLTFFGAMAWRLTVNWNCPATTAALLSADQSQFWRVQQIEFFGTLPKLEPGSRKLVVANTSDHTTLEYGTVGGHSRYPRVVATRARVSDEQPLRTKEPKQANCDYLLRIEGLTISLDAETPAGLRTISGAPVCASERQMTAFLATKVQVLESSPDSSERLRVARVIATTPDVKPIALQLQRPIWYILPFNVLIPQVCVGPGATFHAMQGAATLMPDLPNATALAAAVALRRVLERN